MSRKKKARVADAPTPSAPLWPCWTGDHAACTGGEVLRQHPEVTSGDVPLHYHPLVRDFVCPCEHHRRTK